MDIHLTPSQERFFLSDKKFQAFVAGFGSGKTFIGTLKILQLACMYPKIPQGYFAPSYPLVRDIFYPTIQEIAEMMNVDCRINKSDKIVYIEGAAPIYCRTMTKPEEIVGFQIGHALVDEFDTLRTDQAMAVWQKIIARMRKKYPDGRKNGVFVTTTPEGYKATYHIFVKNASPQHEIVHGSTYENKGNLPDGYIESLEEAYPAQLIDAYLRGQFVNLNSGLVYPKYDRHLNASSEVVMPGDTLHVGMDFNILKGASGINVIRDGIPHAVDEIFDAYDTDQQIQILKERYPKHNIIVYPDAAAKQRTASNTTQTDLQKLKYAGFRVDIPHKNPPIKDRIASVNGMILNGKGERRFFVNPEKCPNLVSVYEQHSYDQNGMPDKNSFYDHLGDAQGYFIHRKYPIIKRNASQIGIIGLAG